MRALLLLLLLFACQVAAAQFTTVINVPPDNAPSTVPAGTQVNVFEGGGFVGRGARALNGSEVNFYGGNSGLTFSAGEGSTVNIFDGTIGFSFNAHSGSQVWVAGGDFDHGLTAQANSQLTVSGGTFSERTSFTAESQVRILGDEFSIDGVPVAGLVGIGDAAALILPNDAVFTGTFLDGTTFAFSSLDQDFLADGAVALERAEVPTAIPGNIIGSIDGIPTGVRNGQTLIVDDGTTINRNLTIAPGGALHVMAGGQGNGRVEAVGASVLLDGGLLNEELLLFDSTFELVSGVYQDISVFKGSHAIIRGGESITNDRTTVHAGGTLTLHGGQTGTFYPLSGSTVHVRGGAPTIRASESSQILFHGTDFRLNGVPVELTNVPPEGQPVDVPLGSHLSGVLPTGEPFVLVHDDNEELPNGTVALLPAFTPPIEQLSLVTSIDGPVRGVRDGQTLVVDSMQGITTNGSAVYAKEVRVVSGGTVGSDFDVVGTQVFVDGGSIAGRMSLHQGATVTMSDGWISSYSDMYSGSHLTMYDGDLGSFFRVHEGASVYVAGGDVNSIRVLGEVVITGGEIGVGAGVSSTGTLVLAGGQFPESTSTSPNFSVGSGGTLILYGDDFALDGALLGMTYGVPRKISQRSGQMLEATLLDGSSFELKLEYRSDPGCCVLYNWIDPDASVFVVNVIPGDLDLDGTVGENDLVIWHESYGVGGEGDADFDGDTDGHDLLILQRNYGRSSSLAGLHSVPEPCGISLVSVVSLVILATSRQSMHSAHERHCRNKDRQMARPIQPHRYLHRRWD